MTIPCMTIEEFAQGVTGMEEIDPLQSQEIRFIDFHALGKILQSRVERGLLSRHETGSFIERASLHLGERSTWNNTERRGCTFSALITLAVGMFGQERADNILSMDPSEMAQVFTVPLKVV